MSIQSHLSELQRKHQTMAAAVERAEQSHAVDHLEVAQLKKHKLRLKEEIERLRAH